MSKRYSGRRGAILAIFGICLTAVIAWQMRSVNLPDFQAKAAAATVPEVPVGTSDSEALILAREVTARARSTSELPAGAVDMQIFLADFSSMQTTVSAWLDVGNHRDVEVISWTQTVVKNTNGKDQLLGTLVYKKKSDK